MKPEVLSPDLVWQTDGHLTEVALSTMGDGQWALLPEQVFGHLDGCQECSMRLGQAALLSLRTGDGLKEIPSVLDNQPVMMAVAPPARLPVWAMITGLLLAAIGMAPGMILGAGNLHQTWSTLGRTLTVVLRTCRNVVSSGAFGFSGWMIVVPWISAALLLVVGFAVARTAKNTLSLKGGI